MLKKFSDGFSAGVLIAVGGSVFLSCDNKYVGAVLFSVALLCICLKGYSLFTGKVGFMPEKHGKEEWSVLLLGLFGNAVSTLAAGLALRYGIPAIGTAASAICEAKLLQAPLQTLIRAFFCGILMYLAVSIYRDEKRVIGILFCIPVFILSGFEHSIANMFYFAAAGSLSLKVFGFVLICIAGNALGGILLPCISMIRKR